MNNETRAMNKRFVFQGYLINAPATAVKRIANSEKRPRRQNHGHGRRLSHWALG